MPKTLPAAYLQSFASSSLKLSDDDVSRLSSFQLPETIAAWREKTVDADAFFLRPATRGDTLKLVDHAYEAWINNDITNYQNACNLNNALETYRGFSHRLRKFGVLERDRREARNRNGVMGTVHEIVTTIARLDSRSPVFQYEKDMENRRRVLMFFANIDVEWNWKSGLAGAAGMINEANTIKLDSAVLTSIQKSLTGTGGQFLLDESLHVNRIGNDVKEVAKTFFTYLKSLFKKFKEWAAEKISSLMGGDRGEIISTLSAILGVIFDLVAEKATPFLSGATDIVAGLEGLVTDAWIRSTISAQKTALVTAQGAFALIRDSIEYGIKLRQAVAGWTMVKGVVSVAVTATTGMGEIANMILSGLEFAFKMVFNLLESRRIQSILLEVRNFLSAPNSAAAQKTITAEEDKVEVVIPMVSLGYMLPFKSTSYTMEDFLTNSKAAYLNFLYSLFDASPIMAAIVMNSGVVKEVNDVFHPATPRSTINEQEALDHIATLKGEAQKLYNASVFKVVDRVADSLDPQDKILCTEMVTAAKLN
jgi:hypothetical protein